MSDNIVQFPYYRLLLPDDVVAEILLKLPSKSLIRFKSVCRSWCSTIGNPRFLAKHLLPDRGDRNLLLVKRQDKTNRDHVFSLLSDQTLREYSQTRLLPYPTLRDKVYPSSPKIEILGSCCCNGLMCLFDTDCDYIVLWSPANAEIKILPNSNVPNPPRTSCGWHQLGFGYDSNSDDYKVIRISMLIDDEIDMPIGYLKVEIYSFKTDSWTGTAPFHLPAYFYPSSDHRSMAYLNGVFLWWASTHPNGACAGDAIMWFRMSDDSFGTAMLPPDAHSVAMQFDHLGQLVPQGDDFDVDGNVPYWYNNFFVLNGRCIALIVFDWRQRVHKCFHVWVLLEFGVEDSWTRWFTVGPLVSIERPVWFWNNAQMIMENSDGDLVLCDPFTLEIKSLNVSGLPKSLQIVSIGDPNIF